MSPGRAEGIRERNRAVITEEIVSTARAHLATDGANGLSLRAVARDLGMAPSALYRYFPSRDDLLTRLILDAYTGLADTVAEAEAEVSRADYAGRFRAVGHAVRRWALAHEHEYALIYGTPVPGYRAPQDTIEPATRVSGLLIVLLADAVAGGAVPTDLPDPDPAVLGDMAPMIAFFGEAGVDIPAESVLRGVMAWTFLYGAVTFELFGQLHNAIASERAPSSPFFDAELERWIDWLGIG